MMQFRTIHRIVSMAVVIFTLYLGVTGSLIELIDFRTLASHPPAQEPNLMAMREDFAGPPNFRVLSVSDHSAAPLPGDLDLSRALHTVMASAHDKLGAAPVTFVELRMSDEGPVGQVQSRSREWRFDARSGAALGQAGAEPNEDQPPASQRNVVKHLHRMTTFGDWALWINIIVSAALVTLIVTGVVIYLKVFLGRLKLDRTNPFWKAGGTWRQLHRSVSLVAAVFLSLVALSGAWLAVESLCFGIYNSTHHSTLPNGKVMPGALGLDASSPLDADILPQMLQVTLASYAKSAPGAQLRVIRLRNYGTMHQGVVITTGDEAKQLVFDAISGRRVSLTEPGYPPTGFPFGWQAHQTAKSIHRGDFFGLTGRTTSLLAGLSMIYLSISGIVMYLDMWKRRAKSGRRQLVWG